MEKVILRLFTPPGDNVTPPRPKQWMERASESEREKERGMCPWCVDRKREVLCEVEKYPDIQRATLSTAPFRQVISAALV